MSDWSERDVVTVRRAAYAAARHCLDIPDDAEDIAQEVICILLSSLRRKADLTIAEPKAWCRSVSRRLSYRVNRRRAQETASSQMHEPLVEDQFAEVDLLLCTASLGQRQREIFYWRFVQGLAVSDVGRIVGLSDGSIKRELHWIRRRLSSLLA